MVIRVITVSTALCIDGAAWLIRYFQPYGVHVSHFLLEAVSEAINGFHKPEQLLSESLFQTATP